MSAIAYSERHGMEEAVIGVVIPFVGWTPRPTGKPFEASDGRGVHPTDSLNSSAAVFGVVVQFAIP